MPTISSAIARITKHGKNIFLKILHGGITTNYIQKNKILKTYTKEILSMKSIKKMLLGIALLIIACGTPLWLVIGGVIGAVIAIVFFIAGVFFLVDGYLSIE